MASPEKPASPETAPLPCVIVVADDAAAPHVALAELARELGMEVRTVSVAPVLRDKAHVHQADVAFDDWHAVLARSRRAEPDAIGALERDLAGLQPVADDLAADLTGHPLIFVGETSVLGALSLAGSYVAVTSGTDLGPAELLGLQHADEIAATSIAALERLGQHGLFGSAVVYAPSEDATPQRLPTASPTAPTSHLVVRELGGINPDVSFAVLEALVQLNGSGTADLILGEPMPAETEEWATGLDIRDRLLDVGKTHGADVILCTSSDPDDLVRAAQFGARTGAGVASVFEHPLARPSLGDMVIPWGSTAADLAGAIETAATTPVGSPDADVTTSIPAQGLLELSERAVELASEPGHRFRAVRQKLWELHYEGESADGYDDKYHAAACYEALDRTLAQLVASHLPASPASRRILDLGCGPGSMVPFLLELGDVDIVGVDVSPAMLDHARRRFPDSDFPRLAFELGSTDAINRDDDSFDVVLVSGVLHHLPSLRTTLEEISRVLTPDGWLIVREPNEDNFTHQQSDLALAHQCVRSLVLDRFGHRPVWEPEAHDDHTDFTPRLLAEAMAGVFTVDEVSTAGVVSYFHDTLNAAEAALVADLESTLADQPGLNLFVSARQVDSAGSSDGSITPDALAQIDVLERRRPVAADHMDALLAVASDLLADADLFVDAATQHGIDERIGGVLAGLDANGLVMDHGGHVCTATWPLRHNLESGEPTADVVSVVVGPADDLDVIELAASRVRDHGWLVVDIADDVDLSGWTPGEHASALTCTGVAASRHDAAPAGHARVLARRHALARADLVTALEIVLQDLDTIVEPVSKEQLAQWTTKVERWRFRANWTWEPGSFAALQHLSDVLTILQTR